jgi:hypothetical protein
MAGLSRRHKSGTGNRKSKSQPNKRKLDCSNNPDGKKSQKKLAENTPAIASTSTVVASTPASTDAATTSSSPSLEDVGTPSCLYSPAAYTPNTRSSKRNPRLPDIGGKKGEESAPTITKSTRNNTNFIQFILSSEKEYHEIVDELSMKGFENLTDKMSSTMPHIRACKVGDKIVVEVQLLGTSTEEQEQSGTCVAAATAPPSATTAAPSGVDDSLRFNNRRINFESILESKLDYESFDMNKHGDSRNADAVRQAQSRARSKIVDAIKLAGHTKEQQALALHLALLHEDIQEIAKTAGFKNDTSKIIAYQWEQMKEIIQDATKNKGTSNTNQEQFMNTIFTAVAPNTHEAPDGKIVADPNAPSMRGYAKALGLGRSRVTRQITKGMKKRRELRAATNSGPWATLVKKRKGKLKISPEAVDAVVEYIVHHENVIHSPIANDSLLIKLPGMTEKSRVGKLLLECSVRDLHNRMVAEDGLKEARDSQGEILISDTTLRKIIKEKLPQLRRLTAKHKQMCGCETCLTISSNHKSLMAFRQRRLRELKVEAEREDQEAVYRTRAQLEYHEYRHYVFLVNNDDDEETMRYPKPRNALECIMCPPVASGYRHWNCMMRRCENCPQFPYHESEQRQDDQAPTIRFHRYCNATKCSVHGDLAVNTKTCQKCEELPANVKKGKVRTRKHLTLLTRSIGTFMKEYYLKTLEIYAYHLSLVHILSKKACGEMRRLLFESMPGSVRTIRDYAERLLAIFDQEAQSEHFGNGRSLSMEGSAVVSFYREQLAQFINGEIDASDLPTFMEFHSHFSDFSKQDAASTYAHTDKLVTVLFESGRMKRGGTMFESTDGCTKQYRCGTACFLLSLLAVTRQIIIDRAIGAPGHGKDIVDGLNATDKQFLADKMCKIGLPEVNETDGRMSAASMVEGTSFSLAQECARLCSDASRVAGVKSEGKYAKRENAAPMKRRTYHVQDPKDVLHGGIKMKLEGFKTGKRNGISSMYNIRADPALGIGRLAIRRIPCGCQGCKEQLEIPWDYQITDPKKQARYGSSRKCTLWPVFEGLNDWTIVTAVPTDENDMDELDEAHDIVLETIAERNKGEIKVGSIGAFSTEDECRYYLVEWTSEPYTCTEPILLTEYDPPIVVKKGELVCKARYLEELVGAPRWYEPVKLATTVRLQQVVATSLQLQENSAENSLPSNFRNKTKAIADGAKRLLEEEHFKIISELTLREIVEHEEDSDNNDIEDRSDGEESSDEDTDLEEEEDEEEICCP